MLNANHSIPSLPYWNCYRHKSWPLQELKSPFDFYRTNLASTTCSQFRIQEFDRLREDGQIYVREGKWKKRKSIVLIFAHLPQLWFGWLRRFYWSEQAPCCLKHHAEETAAPSPGGSWFTCISCVKYMIYMSTCAFSLCIMHAANYS